MKKSYTFISAFFTVSSITLVSRITGLVRDILFAAYLGAGVVADAFLIAFQFPNIFRRLFAEGAFSSGFVPLFNEILKKSGEKEAILFVEEVLSVLICILLLFIFVMLLAMPLVVLFIAPGFSFIPNQVEYTTELARLTFPYLFFISLVSLQSGILNAFGRFASPAATPIILNITLILSLFFALSQNMGIAVTLCWGILLAGLLQFFWLYRFILRIGISLKIIRPRITPRVMILIRRILPVAFGAGLYQINLVVDKLVATLVSTGAVSWLYFADRINQLPVGVVGVGIGVVLLPLLSQDISEGRKEEALFSQNRAIELGLTLSIPASVGILILSIPIISIIFERGLFTTYDREAVSAALVALASGLPAYILIKSLVPGFFSRQDTVTPVKVAAFAMVVNIALNLILMYPLGHVGIALATSISAWLNALFLGYILLKRKHLRLDSRFYFRIPRIILSSIFMGIIIWIMLVFLTDKFSVFYDIENIDIFGEIWRTSLLLFIIVVGFVSYVISLIISGGARFSDLSNLKSKKS